MFAMNFESILHFVINIFSLYTVTQLAFILIFAAFVDIQDALSEREMLKNAKTIELEEDWVDYIFWGVGGVIDCKGIVENDKVRHIHIQRELPCESLTGYVEPCFDNEEITFVLSANRKDLFIVLKEGTKLMLPKATYDKLKNFWKITGVRYLSNARDWKKLQVVMAKRIIFNPQAQKWVCSKAKQLVRQLSKKAEVPNNWEDYLGDERWALGSIKRLNFVESIPESMEMSVVSQIPAPYNITVAVSEDMEDIFFQATNGAKIDADKYSFASLLGVRRITGFNCLYDEDKMLEFGDAIY